MHSAAHLIVEKEMAILKNLVAADPIVRGNGADPKLVLRHKLHEALTDQLTSVKLAIEGKRFDKVRVSKKRNGEEVTKNVKFRAHYGKNAMGDFVYELRFGNKPLPIPQLKNKHVIQCGKSLEDVQTVLNKLIEATNAGELDAMLIKASNERKEARAKRGQQAA